MLHWVTHLHDHPAACAENMQAGPVNRQPHHQQPHGLAQRLLGAGCAEPQELLQQSHQLQDIPLRRLARIIAAALLLLCMLRCLCSIGERRRLQAGRLLCSSLTQPCKGLQGHRAQLLLLLLQVRPLLLVGA